MAEQVGGSFEGDPDLRITGVGPIEDARPGQVAFLANEKYARHLATTRASAVLVRAGAEAVGGQGGGGRPDMAQAGGPDGAKASEAVEAIAKAIAAAS